jgi:protein phosphatase
LAADAVPATRTLAGGLSEKGRRETNEDAAILAVLPAASGLKAFAILSDGMGGHNAGEVASRITVEMLREKVLGFGAKTDVPASAAEAEVRGWIQEVNREIHRRGRASAEQKGMGATVAFAMILADDRLLVANVGDSKVFLVSGLKVRQLSVDHTALAEQRRALGSDSVAPEDDASNPFAHALTRSLGQEKDVDPDVRSDVVLGEGDAVLLTTDGVTDVLEAERFLTALETTGSLQETAEEIYRLAFEAGSKDNISVALLSRGTPSRLGIGRSVVQAPAAAPVPSAAAAQPADALLRAGAATTPAPPAPRTRRKGLLAAGALLGAAAVAGAVLLTLQRPAPGGAGLAATPSGAAPAPPTPVTIPAPEPSAAPGTSSSASLAPQALATEAPAPSPAASGAAPVPRKAVEPSFRPPAALSGLQPLEYPPTPTDTPTPLPTPTATATETATPVPPAQLPAGTPAPAAAPSPRVRA